MITEKAFKETAMVVLVIGLFILAILVVKPVALSIIWGILLAYIFYPIYRWTVKVFKSENLSAFLICILLFLVISIPAIIIFNSLANQIIKVYVSLQSLDLASTLRQALPSELSSSPAIAQLSNSLNSFVPKIISYIINRFSGFVLNIPAMMLQLFIVIFVFFFALRDGKKAREYLKPLFNFKKEISEKLFAQFRDVTNSVLLGQVVIGVLQGVVAGIGYLIFGVPYALFFTILTIIVGIFPILGPWLVWIPIDIYLFLNGKTGAGIGLLIYGILIITWLDAIIKPLIVSRKTQVSSAVIIIGMIGGLFVFGILGLILGPLVLSYVLLVIELYRSKKIGESIFFKQVERVIP